MKIAICVILVFSYTLLFISCNTTEPPPPPNGEKPTLELTIEDVSCTEAWIKLTTTNLQLPATITLEQYNPTGDSLSQNFILNTQDSLLYIDSFLPNQTYQYQVSSIQHQVSSNELSVTTMDTTSHNFTFETFTFGGTAGSSVLYDVAIINENNIWAVGEIYVADTSQNGYTMYNAVHWDGNQWELKRIMFYTICGQQHQNAYPASSIFTFSVNDIWVGMLGSQIARLNDTTQISIQCIPVSVRKLWGSDNQNIYAVGVNGKIAYYNGTIWQQIESGTELNINDIWGDYNERTSNWEMLAVASNYSFSWEKEILLIKNNSSQKLSTASNPSMEPLLTSWFVPNRQYYVAGAGIYQKHLLQDSLWKHNLFNITTFATTSIHGNNINDVIGVGAFGDFLHFNGASWKNDYEEPILSNGSYMEVSIKGDLIVAVGSNQTSLNSEAIVLIGRR